MCPNSYEDGDSEELAWEEVFGKDAKDTIKDIQIPAAAIAASQSHQTAKEQKGGNSSSGHHGPRTVLLQPCYMRPIVLMFLSSTQHHR